MSAFGSPWEDIDRTLPGQPYVVSSDGWGWLLLFILLMFPFLFLGALLTQITEEICAHPYISIGIYLLFSLMMSLIISRRQRGRFRILSIIATMSAFLPFALAQMLYTIPYIMQNTMLSSVFEWLIITALMIGLTCFILAICNVLQSRLAQLMIASVYLALTCLILFSYLSHSREINWDTVRTIYSW